MATLRAAQFGFGDWSFQNPAGYWTVTPPAGIQVGDTWVIACAHHLGYEDVTYNVPDVFDGGTGTWTRGGPNLFYKTYSAAGETAAIQINATQRNYVQIHTIAFVGAQNRKDAKTTFGLSNPPITPVDSTKVSVNDSIIYILGDVYSTNHTLSGLNLGSFTQVAGSTGSFDQWHAVILMRTATADGNTGTQPSWNPSSAYTKFAYSIVANDIQAANVIAPPAKLTLSVGSGITTGVGHSVFPPSASMQLVAKATVQTSSSFIQALAAQATLDARAPVVSGAVSIDAPPASLSLEDGGGITLYWNGLTAVPPVLELEMPAPTLTVRSRAAPPEYTEDEYRLFFNEPLSVVTRRVEILEADGNTLWDDGNGNFNRLMSGQVTIDYTRDERRAADLELTNFDKALIHQPQGFWYDKILRIWRGIKFYDISGERTYEYQLGEFMMDRVVEARFPNTVKITARDYTKKCLLSKFSKATSFSAGYAIETVIGSMASNAGCHDRIFPTTGQTLGKDYFFEAGKPRWEAMKEIADAFGYELFFNAQGYLVLRPYLDPTTSPISFDLSTGPDGNLVDWEKSTDDSQIFNHITVTGSDDDAIPVWAEAINTEPTSPTRIEKLGDRVYPYQSSFVTTDTQAQDLANTYLKIYALESYEVNFSSLNAPWLEMGEITRFTDPDAPPSDPDRFLLTSCTMPLSLDPMTGTGRRVTIVG